MSIDIPAGVSADGTTKVTFVPTIAGAAPTLVELNAGVDLSCYFTADGFSMTGSQDRSEDQRLCSTQNLQGMGRYSPTIDPIVYVFDPQDPENTDDNNEAYATLTPGTSGYFVVRMGLPAGTAWAAGQFVWIDRIVLGQQIPLPPEANSVLKVTQEVAVTGNRQQDVAVVAT